MWAAAGDAHVAVGLAGFVVGGALIGALVWLLAAARAQALAGVKAQLGDTFQALAAQALRASQEGFLTLASEKLGAVRKEAVTDLEEGTAPGAAIPGYRVAGKTGTAQRVGPNGGYDGTFTVSFAGFAPADDPRFMVYVVVQNPANGGGGGSVGGPAFRRIMTHLLQKYAVPPTGSVAPKPVVEW